MADSDRQRVRHQGVDSPPAADLYNAAEVSLRIRGLIVRPPYITPIYRRPSTLAYPEISVPEIDENEMIALNHAALATLVHGPFTPNFRHDPQEDITFMTVHVEDTVLVDITQLLPSHALRIRNVQDMGDSIQVRFVTSLSSLFSLRSAAVTHPHRH